MKKKKSAACPTIFSVTVSIDESSINFSLPKQVEEIIDLSANNITCVVTNGVIQISGKEPHLTIPALLLTKKAFRPHSPKKTQTR